MTGQLPSVGETVLHFCLLQPLDDDPDQAAFIAEDVDLKRRVCLRFLPTPYWQSKDLVRRFQEDARKLASLRSPHIVALHELGTYHDRPFAVFDCYGGLYLRDIIPEVSRRPVLQLGEILLQAGRGLQAAHDTGLAHYQVTPSRVALDPQHRAAVTGFLLGGPYEKSLGDAPEDVSRSYEYASPEQLEGSRQDYRSDIFSLGVVMYETLTGVQPFRAESRTATVNAILHASPRPVTELRPGLPEQVADVVARAIEKNPNERFQRVDHLLAAFSHALAEVRLEDSREFLINVINGLDDPLFVKDENHRWVILNDAMCSLIGRPREELIGKSDYEIFPKEQADVFWSYDSLVLKTGRTSVNEEEITAQGVTRTISTKKSILREPLSGRRFIVGTIRDISDQKALARQLKERHQRYELAAAGGNVGVWDWDLLTDHLFVDPHIKGLLGYEDDEIENRLDAWLEHVHPDDRDSLVSSVRRYLNGDSEDYEVEHRMLHRDGGLRWIVMRGSIVRNESGDAVRMIGTQSDMTRYKETVSALQESEEKYRSVVERANDGICIVFDKKLVYVNRRLGELLGFDRRELLGTNYTDYIHPGEISKVAQMYGARMAGQEVPERYETILLTSSGESLHVEFNSAAITYNGRRAALAIIRDITERRRAESAIRESERTARALLNAPTDDVVVLLSTEGEIIDANEQLARRFGLTVSEIVGKSAWELFPADVTEHRMEQLRKVLETRKPVRFEDERLGRWYDHILYPVLNRRGEVGKVAAIARDVTERRIADRALRESERSLEEAQRIAHVGSFRLSADGDTASCTDEMYRILGLEPGSVAPTLTVFMSFVHPDDRAEVESRLQHSRATGERYDLKHRIVRPDGSVRYVHGRAEARLELDGKPGELLGTMQDVSDLVRTEQALRARDEEYRAVVELHTEFISRFSPDGILTFVNEAYCRYFGKTREELIGANFIEMIPEEERRQIREFLAGFSVDHPVASIEHQVVLPGGEVRWQQWTDHAIFDDKGEIVGFQSVGRDVTERRQAEEALRESEERFRTLAELSPDGLFVYVQRKIVFVNQAGVRLVGASGPEDLIGRDPLSLVHADYHHLVEERMRTVLDEGEATPPVYQRLVRIDGSSVDVEAASSPLTFKGRPAVQVVLRDVTERNRAEQALRESEEKYRLLVEHQTDLVVRFDLEGRFTFVSPSFCETFGMSSEELLGASMLTLVHEEHQATTREAITRIKQPPHEHYLEQLALTRDGWRWFAWANKAVLDERQRVTAIVAVGRDITERREAEDLLPRTSEALEAERAALMEKNITLKQVLEHIENERQDFRVETYRAVEDAIEPVIGKLRGLVDEKGQAEIDGLELNVKSIINKDIDEFQARFARLTSREAEICALIRAGLSSKEVSDRLNLSLLTVHKHRERIRRKLELTSKDVDLATYLKLH